MDLFARFIPEDRRRALAAGASLPDRTNGAALLADLSGYTALSEALAAALGPQRGAEELTVLLNRVYDALVRAVEGYEGSVLGFAGDAISCWFDDGGVAGAGARHAATAALALQAAMAPFAAVTLPGGATASLGLKVAVTAGPARRFLVGDPAQGLLDVVAGPAMARVGALEEHAQRGEVLLDEATAAAAEDAQPAGTWRRDAESGARILALTALAVPAPAPGPSLTPPALPTAQVQPWLLPAMWERLTHESGTFLTELRPAVALFLRFGGIDYERPTAGMRLDTYIRWVQGVLARYEASLLQLTLGDKGSYLYAAFGAPRAHADEAARAVAAALELRTPPPQCAFIRAVQIGLASGPVWAGIYGGTSRATYGVLGPMVNLAARLMQAAAPGGVLVTQEVQAGAGSRFAWERLPALTVKGKATPVPVWGLVAEEHQRMGLLEPAYHTPLVGRAAELAALADARARVLAGQGQIVAITGEAGLGKSRLVADAARQARAAGFQVYGGAAHSYGTQTAYLAWQPIWRAFFDLDPDCTPDELALDLEDRLAEIDPALTERLPLLGPALGLPLPDTALTAGMDAKLRKESLEALLIDCLKGRAGDITTLIVLEDCHWLDPLSHDLLEALGRASAGLPVLLLLAYRPAELDRAQAPRVETLPHFTELRLGHLPEEDAAQLVAARLGGTTAPARELVDALVARADGNPFYLEELLNYLREQGVDLADLVAVARVEWPASLQSLLLARIDGLSEQQRTVLKVASVIGRIFRRAQLWGVYPDLGAQATVASALDELDRLELTVLDVPEPEWTHLFKHMVTQEVTYSSLPFALRRQLHEQFAASLEAGSATAGPPPPLDLLAHHYGQSANTGKAREYLQKAGDAAAAAWNNGAAIAYYERVLELLPVDEQPPVHVALGEAWGRVGLYDKAVTAYQAALDARPADSRVAAAAMLGLGRMRELQGLGDEAQRWMEQARASYAAAGDAPGARQALGELGWHAAMHGDYPRARTILTESAAQAEAAGDWRTLAASLVNLGWVGVYQGAYTEVTVHFERSLGLYRQLGDRQGIARALCSEGVAVMNLGDTRRAQTLLEESVTLSQELGDRTLVAVILHNLGDLAMLQGDWSRADRCFQESLALLRAMGNRRGIVQNLNKLGLLALEQGDPALARTRFGESLHLVQELGEQEQIPYVLSGLAAATVEDDAAPARSTQATRLAGAATRLTSAIGTQFESVEEQVLKRTTAATRVALGDAAFDAAWAAGQALSLEDALAEAHALLDAAPAGSLPAV